MTKDRSDILRIAGYWLELKRAWGAWKEGQPMPALGSEAQLYFENLGLRTMNDALDEIGTTFENVPRMRDGREAWSQVFNYLVVERPRSSVRLLDDIFLRARSQASKASGHGAPPDEDGPSDQNDFQPMDERTELEQTIGWVINQFKMRVRDGARGYAREHGTPAEMKRTISASKPLGDNGTGPAEATVMDTLQYVHVDDGWGTEMERREMQDLGQDMANGQFAGIPSPAKLSLYLRALRGQRDVIISVDNKVVQELANLGTAQFAQKAVDALKKLELQVTEQPAYQELDDTGRKHYVLCATQALLDRTVPWKHLGECVGEFIEWHVAAGPKKRLLPAEVVRRLEAFAELLLQRLTESRSLFSENELEPLFTLIAKARLTHCQ